VNRPELQATVTDVIGGEVPRLRNYAVIMLVGGAILSAIGAFGNPAGLKYFFHSYLFAYLFWIGVTAGSLGFLMLHYVVGGGWGYVIRRFLEAATRLLPYMAVLFIPVVIGLFSFDLYAWTKPETFPTHELQEMVRSKAGYLNPLWFCIRAAVYFCIWIFFASYLNKKGAILNERNDPDAASAATRMGAFGLLVYVLVVTFMTVDWIMSLTPDWYSSIFGFLVVVSQGLSALAMMILLVAVLAGRSALLREVPSEFFRDLGNFMLTFVMLWGYMSLSQYLITYSGNMTEEVSWYFQRRHHGWGVVSLSLIPFHFFLPFFILLIGSKVKRNPMRLAQVAGFLVFMRLVDIWWWVTPTFVPDMANLGLGILRTWVPSS